MPPPQNLWVGKTLLARPFPGVSAGFDFVGGRRLSYRKSRPGNDAFLRMNSGLPSRLHHRLALNFPGRGDGEGGRGGPPVEPEPSLLPDFPPTDSAEEPRLQTSAASSASAGRPSIGISTNDERGIVPFGRASTRGRRRAIPPPNLSGWSWQSHFRRLAALLPGKGRMPWPV